MVHPRIPLKHPWLAAVLAFLLPGAGHLYQGRRFKAAIYFFCIIPTFLFGMYLGEWRVTYWQKDPSNLLNPYYAQFWVGLPALPSLIQSRRFQDAQNSANPSLESAIAAPFTGILRDYHDADGAPIEGPIHGTITLDPVDPAIGRVKGVFQGTIRSAQGARKIELHLGGVPGLDKRIGAVRERKIVCDIVPDDPAAESRPLGKISGSIPRSFWSWFQVPPSENEVQDLNRRLGKILELAQIFTMIAGLLNILAIWDALEGPAYGYGDPHPKEKEQDPPGTKSTSEMPSASKPDGNRGAERPPRTVAKSGAG